MNAPSTTSQPTVIGGRYRLVRRIATGGMGEIHEARDVETGKPLAIKLPHPDRLHDARARARFRKEAYATARLDSEFCVNVYEVSLDGELPYIAMEFIAGRSLRQLLDEQEKLAAPRAVRLVLQAAKGIQAAHSVGVVHRDVKPENMMVSQLPYLGERLKVLDFGIARLDGIGKTTATGAVLGTPHYMSPEQARGDDDIDERTDVYSLCAVLFELLCGKVLHPGDSYNKIVYGILNDTPPSLATLEPSLPAALVAAIERGLAKRRDARFASMDELGNALAPFAPATASETSGTSEVTLDMAVVASPAAGSSGAGGRWRLPLVFVGVGAAFGAGYVVRGTEPVEASAVETAAASVSPPETLPEPPQTPGKQSVPEPSTAPSPAPSATVAATATAATLASAVPPPGIAQARAIRQARRNEPRNATPSAPTREESPEPATAPRGFDPNPYEE